jgi:hypothetical protein
MSQGKKGRPRKDPNRIITPAQIEEDQRDKYKKLQLYYYFSIGREYLPYLSSSRLANYKRVKIRKQLEILDKLNIPHVLGSSKILSPANLTDWVENLYQHRFELMRLGVKITRKTRLASAAQRIVRLFALDIVYLDRVLENGRSICRYRGADPHSDADMYILNEWLERDRQAVVTDLTEGD